jgi:hypothetical protein
MVLFYSNALDNFNAQPYKKILANPEGAQA